MSDPVAELLAQAMALQPEERVRLAEALLARLDPHDTDGGSAWYVELRRRIDEFERGAVQLIPAEQAYLQVRGSLARRRR
ncbi:addiction module protein [Roseateles violae]|uniref:Addiction module protein n=1 Tax=Roseateles violae TaxID=3058042 RepID=A0ABT8E097_9BURK|nr:addiction module protein [Pelomonas sp. PFR6]MDN3923229.1 addiction module protein [Pelomonas sp. PFR6]